MSEQKPPPPPKKPPPLDDVTEEIPALVPPPEGDEPTTMLPVLRGRRATDETGQWAPISDEDRPTPPAPIPAEPTVTGLAPIRAPEDAPIAEVPRRTPTTAPGVAPSHAHDVTMTGLAPIGEDEEPQPPRAPASSVDSTTMLFATPANAPTTDETQLLVALREEERPRAPVAQPPRTSVDEPTDMILALKEEPVAPRRGDETQFELAPIRESDAAADSNLAVEMPALFAPPERSAAAGPAPVAAPPAEPAAIPPLPEPTAPAAQPRSAPAARFEPTMTIGIAAIRPDEAPRPGVPVNEATGTGMFNAFMLMPPAPPSTPVETPLARSAEPPPVVGASVPVPSRVEPTMDLSLGMRGEIALAEPSQPLAPVVLSFRRVTDALPIVHRTRFSVFTLPWRLTPPNDALVVVAKATAKLVHGEDATLVSADPPMGDVFADEDPMSSLLYPSDFAVFKPRADVMLVGNAYAPQGGAVANVRFQFGPHTWRLIAVGDRVWDGSAPGKPRPFDRMPLRFERALGSGLSSENPVGRGYKTASTLPNLERPDSLIMSKRDAPRPACFAPVAPRWRQRASKVGTFDRKWLRTRWPFLPEDFDFAHFNAAPIDQQVSYPRGDETFELTAVRPDRSVLHGQLPGIRPRIYAQRTSAAGGEFVALHMNLDTVLFDAEAMTVTLVWRGLLDVKGTDAHDLASLYVEEESSAGTGASIEAANARFQAQLVAKGLLARDAALPDLSVKASANEAAPPPAGPLVDEIASDLEQARAARRPLPKPPRVPRTKAKTPKLPVVPREQVEAWLEANESLAGKDLSGADLRGMDLRARDLQKTLLVDAQLDGARLDEAQCEGLVASRARARDTSWTGATLSRADLAGADLSNANLTGCDLTSANLQRVVADGARFGGAMGEGASFVGARLARADFVEAKLAKANFTQATFSEGRFEKANLDDAKFYESIGERAVFDEASLLDARFEGARLIQASFRAVQAEGSMWDKADLTQGNYEGSHLREAGFGAVGGAKVTFNRADLRGARFRNACLVEARFLKADLMQATLEGADLTNADLRGANLYQAETWNAVLEGADLDQAFVAGSKLA